MFPRMKTPHLHALMKEQRIKIEIRGRREQALRLKVGEKLFLLAAWIIGPKASAVITFDLDGEA